MARLADAEVPDGATVADAIAAPVSTTVGALASVYSGATFDFERTPKVFKTATASSSGNTSVWTPTSGKKFRLMGLDFQLSENSTLGSGAVINIQFQDGTNPIGPVFSPFIPATPITGIGAEVTSMYSLGNGILSALANNTLNINLSSALTAGSVRVNAWGTEE